MNITFEVTPARPVPATPTVTDLLITVTPAATPGPAPLDLALVIDTSGSMGGLPLEMARAAASGLLTRLGPDDRVALVTFSGGPVLHAPLQPVGDSRVLWGHLSSLRATGGTALHAGRMSCGEESHRREEQHSSRSTFSRGCGARGI